MYGLVNAGLRDLVIAEHGNAVWEKIARRADFPSHSFVAMRPYDDVVTYNLLEAAASVLEVSAESLLQRFGEHWILYTAASGYGALLELCGRSYPDFLEQLDSLHGRMKLAMPELDPPMIACTRLEEGLVRIRYASRREGLTPLVVGILRGLGKRFGTTVEIEHVVKRADVGHDEFLVRFESAA